MSHRPFALAAVAAFACLGTTAAAHPHVFVDAEVEVVVDAGGHVTGVRLTWIYDDFFSLLLTEELGIDPDGDLVLTADETAVLTDYITDWPAEYEGDLYLTLGGVPVELGPRQGHSATMVDGLVTETHLRPLVVPVDAGAPVMIQIYDPSFYVAYSIVGAIRVEGADCAVDHNIADLDAAYAMVETLLDGRQASDVGPDEQFPEVGNSFADTIVVTCGG